MKKLFIFIVVVLIMLIISCQTVRSVPIEPPDTSSCPAACDRMKFLHCSEGEDIPGGPSCVQFCVETQKAGHALNPQCLKTINTCEEIYTKCGQ